jgi:hypothetical protein
MVLAPIIIFVYNRPEHTRLTLEALSNNELANESDLFIFADGEKEKTDKTEKDNVKEVRKLIREKKWCKNVTIIESEHNKGLAKSIIEGVTETVNKYDRVIVLEDDLITSPYFLKFMNENLELFKSHQYVYSVNGYMFPITTDKKENILLPYTSTWGWATWKEKWAVFEYEMPQKNLIINNKFLTQRFNLADYPYTSMLNAGNNSWGIRWYYHVFIRNGLGVFPTISLVQNIGFDGTGVNHTKTTKQKQTLSSNVIKSKQKETICLEFYNNYLSYFINKKSTLKSSYEKFLSKYLL